ncbi:ThuA domain-containing protein [Elongatibacter sediminis]|uniref:ThuA domain-containing protein n=1 Tax=Elongatibacter sediminis TaxID=3119006 RepID=A0AAW9RBG3_9GAMM
MQGTARKDVHFVCGGRYHDFDFARLEVLKLLAELPHVRATVASDYRDQDNLHHANALITYTSDVVPAEAEIDSLAQFLREGGRWFALHGTNSSLRYNRETRLWEAPRTAPRFFDMLGSQFEAHPPIRPFTVRPSRTHPLVDGIEPFEADDELYLSRFTGACECLLETEFDGTAPGFARHDWRGTGRVPVMYLHPWEDAEILYLNLGHARGPLDMQPLMEHYPDIERGSWKQPAFYELMRRGIRWALSELE